MVASFIYLQVIGSVDLKYQECMLENSKFDNVI